MKDDSVEKRMNRAGQEKFMVQAVYKIEHGAQVKLHSQYNTCIP